MENFETETRGRIQPIKEEMPQFERNENDEYVDDEINVGVTTDLDPMYGIMQLYDCISYSICGHCPEHPICYFPYAVQNSPANPDLGMHE